MNDPIIVYSAISIPNNNPAINDSNTGTIYKNGDIHLPSARYEDIYFSIDFESYGSGPNGEVLWKFKNLKLK